MISFACRNRRCVLIGLPSQMLTNKMKPIDRRRLLKQVGISALAAPESVRAYENEFQDAGVPG